MTNIAKFSIVAACFALSLLALRKPVDKRDARLLCLGLAFTVIADYFLIIASSFEAGLMAFICVQIVYNIRYTGLNVKQSLALAAACFVFAFIAGVSTLVSLALAYTVLFGFSLAAAARRFADRTYPFPNDCLILAGMVSCAICDVFVALLNSGTDFAAAREGRLVFLIWLFYIPGIFMLSISGISFSSKRNTNFMKSS